MLGFISVQNKGPVKFLRIHVASGEHDDSPPGEVYIKVAPVG